jgi:hypothetical protein
VYPRARLDASQERKKEGGGGFYFSSRNEISIPDRPAIIQSLRNSKFNKNSCIQRVNIIQDPAEIPDDFAKQLCVEPLAWGICP